MEALFGIITYGNSHLAPLMHGEKRGEDVSALGCLTLAAEPCPAMGEGTHCVLWAAWVTSQTCHCCDGRPSATQCHLHRPRGIWCNAASLLLHPAAFWKPRVTRGFFLLFRRLPGWLFSLGEAWLLRCFPGGISEPPNKQ